MGHPPDRDQAPEGAADQWANADRFADRGAGGQAPTVRQIWLSPRAIAMHVTLLIVLPAFVGLFWWQIQRVRQGNTLSWAYVFEWPFFAAYAVYMWWHLVHDQAAPAGASTARRTVVGRRAGGGRVTSRRRATGDVTAVAGPAGREAGSAAGSAAGIPTGGPGDQSPPTGQPEPRTSQEDDEMAAYNRYLAELDASGRRKHW